MRVNNKWHLSSRSQVTRPLSYTKRQFDVEEEDVDKLALRWDSRPITATAAPPDSWTRPRHDMTIRCVFRVDLWNASNLKFGDEFLGGVRVPLRVLGQAGVHDAWWETHSQWFGTFGTSCFVALLLPDTVRLWHIHYLLLWNVRKTEPNALIYEDSLRVKFFHVYQIYIFISVRPEETKRL